MDYRPRWNIGYIDMESLYGVPLDDIEIVLVYQVSVSDLLCG